MKGLILKLPVSKSRNTLDFRGFLKRYGALCFLTSFFLIGLVIGAFFARDADKAFLNSLDFIFATDFESRSEQTIFITFAASMTSSFIFFIAEIFSALSAWGAVSLPLILCFKGVGVGISAGYLYKAYGLQGIGFYMLVMLPGVIILTISLILQARQSLRFSVSVWMKLCKNKTHLRSAEPVLSQFLINSCYMLLGVAIASLTDALTSTFFAGMFSF